MKAPVVAAVLQKNRSIVVTSDWELTRQLQVSKC